MFIDKLINFTFKHKKKLFLAIAVVSFVMDGPPVEEFIVK